MNNDELLAVIEKEEANCISSSTGALAEQRREAMQYYYGQPYGNEIEGRSQVVTTEVREAVEGLMPHLMSVFTTTDEVVRFEAQNPDDEQAAQQATDYANYVFNRLNNGAMVLYCLIKDALLQKNGYCKVYWENYEDQTRESYKDLSDDQFAMLQQDEALELVEHSSKPDPYALQALQMQAQQMAAAGMQMPEVPIPQLHDAAFRRMKKYGKICVDPVPPEEILVSRDTLNDLSKARFVEHRTRKTISEIRQMGYDIDEDIADFAPNAEFNMERIERHKFDNSEVYDETHEGDKTTRRVWLCEAYLYTDFDGDGIAEFRKVTKIGKSILDNEEFDGLPIVGGAAIPIPHKHYGMSVHDLIREIQLIKSTITRQLLDNAYVANNGRMVVLDGMVNMDDLLNARPNGIVRAKTLNAVSRMENPLLGAPFYNLLDYFDKVKQNRVGATDFPNAVDPDAINAKADFVDAYKSGALERPNLMARMLAEGPIKQIFWKILELSAKHQDKPQVVKLRGKWVEVDPREWHNRFNMTVTVGLGTGSQQTTLQGAMGIMEIQGGMLKMGLMNRTVTEANIYKAANKYVKSVFPKDDGEYFTDPSTLPPPQPQPNPDIMKLEVAAHKAQMADAQKRDKMELDAHMKERDRQFQAYTQQIQAQIDAVQSQLDRRNDIAKAVASKDEAMIDSMTKLRVAEKQAQTNHSTTVLEGVIERLAQMQKEAHERHLQSQENMVRLAEIASAEKEIVRDDKGKAKGVRPKVK